MPFVGVLLPLQDLGSRYGVAGEVDEVGSLAGDGVDAEGVGAALDRAEADELRARDVDGICVRYAVGIEQSQLVARGRVRVPIREDQDGSDAVLAVLDVERPFIMAPCGEA